jgi:glycosyltransferase involved in cell wall biosynthesis
MDHERIVWVWVTRCTSIATLPAMGRPITARPSVSFIAWSSVPGRSMEIAQALGGESKCFYDFGFVRARLIPLRYAASAVRTVLHLLIHRPRAVIASNPPVFPGLIAFCYGRITGAPVVLDSHPSAFGFYESKKLVRLMMPLHRYLMSRVQGSIVTVDELVEMVRREGGRAEIVHEAPPLWKVPSPGPLDGRPTVLFVGIFADDEPVEVVAEAARRLPHVDIVMTGDIRKCPPELLEHPAPNLRFAGFLGPAAYRDAVAEADILMTLTSRPEAVNRAANEAVFARRPLIVSDWPAASNYFPHAVRVSNTVEGVVTGINDALGRYEQLRGEAELALAEQQARWDKQLTVLRELVTVS